MTGLPSLPVSKVKGIGEEKEKELNALHIHSVNDLLEYYPYRYEDYEVKDVTELEHDERGTIQGVVQSEPSVQYFGRKKSRVSVRVLTNGVLVKAVFFNRPFVKQQIKNGDELTITGKIDKNRLQMTVQDYKKGSKESEASLEPVYSVGGKVTVKQLRGFIRTAYRQFGDMIEDNLPPLFLDRYKLPSKKNTLFHIHHPKDREALKHARRRIIYEEFLLFQLKMQMFKRIQRMAREGIVHTFEQKEVDEFINKLPFPLTGAQNRVTAEILEDLQSPYSMNRLLQGDVGSGKTVVAAIAMFTAFLSGYQSALMVPTEILAEQHYRSLQELLEPAGLSIALLTGSTKTKARREINEALKSKEIQIVIGTHALIQEGVEFSSLGLVITDEQHRFGVMQRRALKEKGKTPDVLFMTATPIPRTLAISVYGDMDVSVIDEMPAGRKPIETYWAKPHMLERVLGFVQKEVDQGRQAYVICPLIEESDKLDVQNVIEVHGMLKDFYQGYEVGLLHGRLSNEEKEEVMTGFDRNEIHILVSTTVVEVGVNVPNATMMVIYDAERFGLAQLHQLRGRVGRGEHQSYCILIADPKSETGKERMRIMTETNDGFVLSEEDLKLRGPGDFFGQKQSGMPEFKMADVVHDYRALEVARNDAAKLVNSNEFWQEEQFAPLRLFLEQEGVLDGEKLD
ncbi:ATP-dependent DNA helicase RecG [Bacillus sp. FJAT-44742]|uniref:ATP-dependent DNA helicase RecG n=1 Tax=Bacillus sp. FJAT-44742 TaxID=2014005 RepID=UPI000C24717E|nr:ATP-dependent DNA helicase RecG [Bacillus sp. FJAT-44742]